MPILHVDWNRPGGYWRRDMGEFQCSNQPGAQDALSAPMDHDSKLVRTRLGEYYICIPTPFQPPPEQPRILPRVVSLDPGVRSFMTLYDPAGFVCKWGTNEDRNKILKLCQRVDQIKADIANKQRTLYRRNQNPIKIPDEMRPRRRKHLRRRILKINRTVRRMVEDLHCKLAKFLCSNYDVILLPEFNTQEMAAREREDGRHRVISGKTARQLMAWSHFRFKERLLSKQHQFGGCRVHIVNEAYTTKTCGACGELNEDIGSKEIFHCPYCNYEADRDYNAARNIYLKWLLEHDDTI